MRTLLFLGMGLVTLLMSACSTVPQKRVHTASAVPRFVDIAPYQGSVPESGLGFSLGANQGTGVSDVGNLYDATFASGSLYFRQERWALTWKPYLASVGVSHEDTTHMGSTYLGSVSFPVGGRWSIIPQLSAALGSNGVSSEKDNECSLGEVLFLAGLTCIARAEKKDGTAHARVKQTEFGLALAIQRSVGHEDSWFVAPAIYHSQIDRTNYLSTGASDNFVYRLTQWSPALHAGFHRRLKDKIFMVVQAGISSYQEPRTNAHKARVSGDISFRF